MSESRQSYCHKHCVPIFGGHPVYGQQRNSKYFLILQPTVED